MKTRSIKIVGLTAGLSLLTAVSAVAFPAAPRPRLDVVARAVACADPCVITSNNGGSVMDFEDAADAIRAGAREKLVIDGFCASSCMVMADRARPRTCITERAVFGYHKTNLRRPIPLKADLRRWILARGGYPEFGAAPGIMPNEAARQFWPLCKTKTASHPTVSPI